MLSGCHARSSTVECCKCRCSTVDAVWRRTLQLGLGARCFHPTRGFCFGHASAVPPAYRIVGAAATAIGTYLAGSVRRARAQGRRRCRLLLVHHAGVAGQWCVAMPLQAVEHRERICWRRLDERLDCGRGYVTTQRKRQSVDPCGHDQRGEPNARRWSHFIFGPCGFGRNPEALPSVASVGLVCFTEADLVWFVCASVSDVILLLF
jgi:hypothetical protein